MNVSAQMYFKALATLCTAVLMVAGVACHAGDGSKADSPIEAAVNDYESFQQLINQSIEAAETRGQKDVYIHLKEDADTVQPADLVTAEYTVLDPQGRVVYSTRPEMFARIDARYRVFFAQAGAATGPETLLAGLSGLFPGAGHAVLGMQPGQRRTVTVSSEKGFGPADESKIETYPRRRNLPKTTVLPVSAFLKNFDTAPETGKIVRLSPYFPSRVNGVKAGMVTLDNLAADGETVEEPFGRATLAVETDRLVLTLDPTIGASFDANEKKGVVSGKDETHFTVDYNHPLAGKNLTFEVSVNDLKKFSVFEKIEMPWIEDHDTAMEQAATTGKPLVLVLYAEWCQWSQRLLTHTFNDPRIKRYHDRFVWLKIDSDKERVFKEVFEQDGFPMVVLMDPHGEIVKKMGGFQDGGTLALALNKVLGEGPGMQQAAHAIKHVGAASKVEDEE